MDDRPLGDVKSDGEVTHLLECGFKTMCIRKTARSGFFLPNDIPNPTGKFLAGGVFCGWNCLDKQLSIINPK